MKCVYVCVWYVMMFFECMYVGYGWYARLCMYVCMLCMYVRM